ncbi:hypothetical protein [Bdellovibrio sp. HCB-162]|uniref:hypothetical protein n=1 Tax=Bdellovibrio sp. HCB-162 TaxID=3394234 RepID=UPI0039BD36E4
MILMWLGSFVLMMFGLTESQKHAAAFFAKLQKSFFEKGFETTTAKIFVRALDVVVLEASPQKSLYSGLALYNLRILNLRASNLIMCLSILGAWWVLILGLLFLSFNGFFLLGLCALGLIGVWQAPKAKLLLKWIFAVGVFLVGGETMLRNSSVVQTVLGQSDLAFFLADGRFGAVIGILLASVLISFIIQVEFWSLAMALSLLLTNTISFNGALALVAGERIGRMILFWWRSRGLNQDCRRIGWQLSAVSIVGVIIGFLVAGEARSYFDLGFGSDLSAFQDKSLQFVLLFGVILFVQFFAQMIWGHFGSLAKVDELQDAKYFPPKWGEFELLSPTAMSWAKEKVHKRLSEIRYHLQGLGTLKEGQVPEHIQARLKLEEQQLSLLDQSLKI